MLLLLVLALLSKLYYLFSLAKKEATIKKRLRKKRLLNGK
jgi:hypothetical protein